MAGRPPKYEFDTLVRGRYLEFSAAAETSVRQAAYRYGLNGPNKLTVEVGYRGQGRGRRRVIRVSIQ